MATLEERLAELKGITGKGALEERLAELKNVPNTPNLTQGEAFDRSFADRSLDTVANTAAGLGDLASEGIAGFSAGVNTIPSVLKNLVTGKDANIGGEFSENLESIRNTAPLPQLRNISRAEPGFVGNQLRSLNDATLIPSTEDIVANNKRESFSDRFNAALESQEGLSSDVDEFFPGTKIAAETVSDVGAIVGGRSPLARGKVPGQIARREKLVSQFKADLSELPEGLRGKLVDVMTKNVVPGFKSVVSNIGRAGTKATEAGLEGAFLAAVNDGDKSTTMGLAAGGQALGSGALFLSGKAIKHPFLAFGTAWLVSEMINAAGPGEQDFFGSKDFAVQKLVAGFSIGLVAAMAGAGRLRGPKADKFPALLDAITSAPRAAIISRMQEIVGASKEGNDAPRTIMQLFASNSEVFTDDQANALSRAIVSEKEGAFLTEVNRLSRSKSFRDKLAELGIDNPAAQLFGGTPTQQIQRN